MKKYLLALILVLVMAGTAAAYQTPFVYVNGNLLSVPGLLIDSTTYVPLRAVGEALGAQVAWDNGTVKVTTSTTNRPSITGDDAHKAQVVAALDLLQQKDAPDYEMVCRYTDEIKISLTDVIGGGMEAYASSNGKRAFMLSPKIFVKSTAYIASALVHETTHSIGDSSENIAYLHEIAALRILGASQQEINEAESAREYFTK